MDQALELVGRSPYGRLGTTADVPGFVPSAMCKLVLVLSHYKNTSQVRYFFFSYLFIAHKHFRAVRRTDVDDDRSDDEDEDDDKQD